MSGKFVSIVIPAYNEEKRIGKTLEKVLAYLAGKNYDSEIIVVDDGSTDETQKIIKGFPVNGKIRLITNEKNEGKGSAVRKGVLEATGKYIFFTDADLSTPIEELEKFIKHSEEGGYDVVIGSRSIKGADILVHQPFYREMMGKIFNKIVRLFAIRGFIDTQCGAKLFRHAAAKKIFSLQKLSSFAFDVEVLYIAKKLGFKIYEIPVKWMNSETSRVRLISDSVKMFRDVLKIRALHKES